MTTITESVPITARDLRALRVGADRITFHLFEGKSYIRAHRRGEDTSSGFDEYHQVECDVRVNDYSETGRPDTREAYSCYFHAYRDDELRTMFHLAKPGDTFVIEWTRGNDNPLNREIGWHRDEVRLRMGKPESKKVYTFLVGVQVGPDNTARMVRVR